MWAYGAVCVALGATLSAALGRLGAHLAAGVFPAALVLHLSINFHHYLVYGIIWRSRREAGQATSTERKRALP